MKTMCFRVIGMSLLTVLVCSLLCACCVTLPLSLLHEHSFGQWVVEHEASCEKAGQKVRTCECGEKNYEEIPATGHTDVEWIIDEPATCTEDGSKHQICSVCDKTLETATIPSYGGHDYSGKVTTEATCDQDGITTYTCSNCDHSYTERFSHPVYTATQIYNSYLNKVGEVVTYDKQGNSLSLGTCFVCSEDGKLITNYHVIDGSYSIEVTLGDRVYDVTHILAYDKTLDIAVLKINASGLTPSVLCDSNHSVGATVYAFGNSQGLTSTFSDGIITYSNRDVDGIMYVQHDAPISSGNSGGPLINEFGEVIGINTWTVRDSQNLNFAIHISELSKLSYGNSLTVAEFYEKECNPFLRMVNYIMSEGNYDSDGYYYLTLGYSYSSDYSSTYTRRAYYYPDDNKITLDFIIDDGDDWAYITLYEDLSGVYDWIYYDFAYDDYVGGTLYAWSFDSDTTLSYDDYSYTNYTSLYYARELAEAMLCLLCTYIDQDFSDIGVTAADLGFNSI